MLPIELLVRLNLLPQPFVLQFATTPYASGGYTVYTSTTVSLWHWYSHSTLAAIWTQLC